MKSILEFEIQPFILGFTASSTGNNAFLTFLVVDVLILTVYNLPYKFTSIHTYNNYLGDALFFHYIRANLPDLKGK